MESGEWVHAWTADPASSNLHTASSADEEGHPVAGAQVVVLADGQPMHSTMLISDAAGAFSLDALPQTGGQVGLLQGYDATSITDVADGEVVIVAKDVR